MVNIAASTVENCQTLCDSGILELVLDEFDEEPREVMYVFSNLASTMQIQMPKSVITMKLLQRMNRFLDLKAEDLHMEVLNFFKVVDRISHDEWVTNQVKFSRFNEVRILKELGIADSSDAHKGDGAVYDTDDFSHRCSDV